MCMCTVDGWRFHQNAMCFPYHKKFDTGGDFGSRRFAEVTQPKMDILKVLYSEDGQRC